MKLLFDSLDAILTELRDRKVTVVRISLAIDRETGARTGGIPHLTSRVILTAAVDDHLWTEWRHWVGRAVAEVSERGLDLPATLQRKGNDAIAIISKLVDDAGFEIREGHPRPRHRGHGHFPAAGREHAVHREPPGHGAERRRRRSPMRELRSPKVRRIVALRGQAANLRAGHQGVLERAAPLHHRADRLDEEARVLKGTLTECELRELRRAWSGV